MAATVYRPASASGSATCVFTLTPYGRSSYHDRGMYFAAHGLVFLTVDVRGRGDSEGEFTPNIQEAKDGYDVVEWLARQPYCSGKVGMWGGSYAGYDQWATAKERPSHLATIVPVAAPYIGVDFPMQGNIGQPYTLQWLVYAEGRSAKKEVFADPFLWSDLWARRFKAGLPFSSLGEEIGYQPKALKDWIAHATQGAYWDAYNPTAAQYAALDIPILTITGDYDGDQPGALTHYRLFMKAASPEERARHFLVIGPWDHAGTRTPTAELQGVKFGPAALLDVNKLHLEWYNWTMAGGPRPEFLRKPVAYYVIGADKWRYADSLEAVTAEQPAFYLGSTANADRIGASGSLATGAPGAGGPDHYVSDPRDVSSADHDTETLARSSDPTFGGLIDQHATWREEGHELIYQTPPFDRAREVSGFFRLTAWIAIDQPDTDLDAQVYEIDANGGAVILAEQLLRARYRESLRHETLVTTREPLRYDFDKFNFTSRRVAEGSRLRLVIRPVNSMSIEKNYNAAKPVADQTMADARAVTVRLFHDRIHPSALYVPFGAPE